MTNPPTIELKDIDPEDISDVLLKVEQSFCIQFGDIELKDIKTFGALCDIIATKVQGDSINDCTTQQAFYKIRSSISDTLNIDKSAIRLDTELEQLFPRYTRRKNINKLQSILGISVNILDFKEWVKWTVFIGVILSLLLFFFKWQFALCGLALFVSIGWTAKKYFSTEFNLKTVAQLTHKLTRENYIKSRRHNLTINKNEIEQIVKELFKHELELKDTTLTKQTTFG